MSDLYWHCLHCGDHKGASVEYELGDHEPCVECGGMAHVVTLRMGAAYEQGLALGLSLEDAWTRAQGAASVQ